MSDLFIAVWRRSFDDFMPESPAVSTIRLRGAARAAHDHLQAAAVRMGVANPHYIFVAPEYYFTRDQRFGLFTVAERDGIYRDLARISGQCGNMLILPGTVNWKLDLGTMAPLVPGNRHNRTFGGTSTAPVFAGGAKIFEYDKRMNDGNIDRDTDAVFMPGTKSPLFNHNGIGYGIEVCGDLAQGRLRASTDNPIDVEVLMSATINHSFSEGNIDQIPVRPGGAFIHCDASGAPEKNGVWVVQRGQGWHGSAQTFSPTPGWRPDPRGMRPAATAPGNVSRIGQLQPPSGFEDLDCYVVSI